MRRPPGTARPPSGRRWLPEPRLIGASRILNEAALIEPFLRHHAALLHHHVIFDNGSTDGTVEIIRALKDEGISVEVHQAASPVYAEMFVNTLLYRLARERGADWVLFLDCDELIHLGHVPEGLVAVLATVPAELPCTHLPLMDYLGSTPETAREANPFLRLVRRRAGPQFTKVFIRGMDAERVAVDAGSHGATVDKKQAVGPVQRLMVLAHYPERDPAQAAAKAVVGRLKVIAAGSESVSPVISNHYIAPFEALQRDPADWLKTKAAALLAWDSDPDLILDPAPYLGGALRHTPAVDETARLLSHVVRYAETLARSHGDIMDRKRLIRGAVLKQATAVRRLF